MTSRLSMYRHRSHPASPNATNCMCFPTTSTELPIMMPSSHYYSSSSSYYSSSCFSPLSSYPSSVFASILSSVLLISRPPSALALRRLIAITHRQFPRLQLQSRSPISSSSCATRPTSKIYTVKTRVAATTPTITTTRTTTTAIASVISNIRGIEAIARYHTPAAPPGS